MYTVPVTKNKLIELKDNNIAFNIINTYFEKDETNNRYRKIYNIILQNKPIPCEAKKSNKYLLGRIKNFSSLENYEISFDLTDGKIREIIADNKINKCCNDNKIYDVVLRMDKDCIKFYCSKHNAFIRKDFKIVDDKYLEHLRDMKGSIANYVSAECYLAKLIEECDNNGWVYNKVDTVDNSSIIAWNNLIKDSKISDTYRDKAIEYINTFNYIYDTSNSNSISSFDNSIKLILDKQYISYQDINVICFLYKKVADSKVAHKSTYIKNIGDIFEGDVIFSSRITGESKFGTYFIYKFEFNESPIVYMSNRFIDLKEGKSYKIKCTVKEHNVFRNIKQTKVSNLEIQ